MDETSIPGVTVCDYLVDEAGDPDLFKTHGTSIIGKDGCSKFFILGLADMEEPQSVAAELEALRKRLLADPCFKGIPSTAEADRVECDRLQSACDALKTSLRSAGISLISLPYRTVPPSAVNGSAGQRRALLRTA